MQITGVYAERISFTISSVSVSGRPVSAASAERSAKAQGGDRVEISEHAGKGAQASVASRAVAASPKAATAVPEAPDRSQALWDALDADGDGRVTRREFAQGARKLLGEDAPSASTLARLFHALDRDRDGAVDRGELSSALTRLDRRQAAAARPQHEKHEKRVDGGGAPPARTTTLTVVSVAIERYTAIATIPS